VKISLIPSFAGFLFAGFIGFAAAQVPPPGRVPHPPMDVAAALGIDADRAAQVQQILRASREKMRAAMDAIRSETDQQLAAILSPEEIKRLHEATKPRQHRVE